MSAKFPQNDMEVSPGEEADELFGFFKAWFVFVAVLALLLMAGGIYVVWLLLGHFGVIA